MFRNQESPVRRNRLIIIGSVIGLSALLLIILLAVLIPKHRDQPQPLGPEDRIECPGFKDRAECEAHGCAFDSGKNAPSCYMNKDTFGYTVVESSTGNTGIKGTLQNHTSETPYGPSIASVAFEVVYVTENILRVKLTDAAKSRYEVPVQKKFNLLGEANNPNLNKLAYEVTVAKIKNVFSFEIKRKGDGVVLWDTSIGGLVMSDKFLQIASYLPSKNIYGLGENTHPTLRHNLEYKTWPIFARDRFPEPGQSNLYGTHPFYTCLENSTKSHGVLFLNSNAMEVTLLPAPAISFRTIGGIIDLVFFVGDNPEHVVQLYTSVIGRPMIPPFWGLGFQLSKYGYNSLSEVKKVVERTRQAGIAQDVQFLDIDHMDHNRDFTYDKERFKGLTDYIKQTKENYDLKWIIIVDPAIEAAKNYSIYETGLEKDVFIKRSPHWKPEMFPENLRSVNVTFGKVWPDGPVGFPDFLKKETSEWWINTIDNYHKELPFDGLWIDMNEPSNFETNEDQKFWTLKCPPTDYEDPPYNPLKTSGTDRLSKMTLCMESVQSDGNQNYIHYDVHTLYGWSQSQPTLLGAQKATGTRSLVISRSTYPSSGRYAGHWLGDNKSSWTDLRMSIIGMLEFNMFGIPYIGADICGFFDDTTDELCKRWMQLGAFYPFFRNHNGLGTKDQDPAIMSDDVKDASLRAVERRYILRNYLYTLFYKAHVDGSTVVRPLFHEFPEDSNTWNIGEQFMWGDCLLISPVLYEGASSVKLYLPKAEWWRFNYEKSEKENVMGDYVTKSDISDNIPLHVKGGCIIPTEKYQLKKPSDPFGQRNFTIYVFLQNNAAEGYLYMDYADSIDPVEKEDFDLYKLIYYTKDSKSTFVLQQPHNSSHSRSHLWELKVFGKQEQNPTLTKRSRLEKTSVTTYRIDRSMSSMKIDLDEDYVSQHEKQRTHVDSSTDIEDQHSKTHLHTILVSS